MPLTSTRLPLTSTRMPLTSTRLPLTSARMPFARARREDEGLLWVFPESGADGLLASLNVEPHRMKEVAEPDDRYDVQLQAWALRDLPYGYADNHQKQRELLNTLYG
eukprot:1645793-Pyramimonas_sp.AAC.1